MDIVDIIGVIDSSVTVIVLVYFGNMLSNQMARMHENQQDIIMQLIRLCADDGEK